MAGLAHRPLRGRPGGAIAGEPDVYSQQGWVDRVDLPYRDHEIGYGHTPAQVREFRITDPALLTDYYAAVHEATLRLLADLTADDLDRLVDDPFQVSVGVRLVSVVNESPSTWARSAICADSSTAEPDWPCCYPQTAEQGSNRG